MKIVTRVAPSPTGYLHFGLARTALFNYLYAKKNGGEYILRIEDTDVARNKPEFESDIREQFEWLGLIADRTYRQSDNRERHKECLSRLITEDKAYVSKEPAKDDASRIVEVVRLRNPGEVVSFADGIRGSISFDTTELKDFVIARSVNEPLYHFAVVVDDHDEGVTHVMRGDDHISNTPRQMLILRALGFDIPEYIHLPLILMPDKTKMSKRKHESSVKHYRESGILAGALLNYIAHLGWTPESGREILTLDEMISEFDIAGLHKSGAVFDVEKLRWYNREYLQHMPESVFETELMSRLQMALAARGTIFDEDVARKMIPTLKERISLWSDIDALAREGELDFFFIDPEPAKSDLPGKGSDTDTAIKHLKKIHELLSDASDEIYTDYTRLKDVVWEYASAEGRAAVLWPMRYALSAKAKSPDPFTIASAIGKDKTLFRLQKALRILEA